jgi:hypothetical protein
MRSPGGLLVTPCDRAFTVTAHGDVARELVDEIRIDP